MVAQCVSPIKAQVARFTRLDACGVPVTGEGSAQVTTDGFISIANSPQYEEGQRFLQRKANGEPCVNERDPGFFNWIQQTVSLCTLDPDAIVIATGETLITDGVTGTGVMLGEGLLTARFSKEVWQPVAGEGACDASGLQRYVYWAFPNEGDAQITDFTFENDVFNFGWISITKRASPLWNIGDPWLDGAVWGPGKHYAFNITTEPPPEAACGAVEVAGG